MGGKRGHMHTVNNKDLKRKKMLAVKYTWSPLRQEKPNTCAIVPPTGKRKRPPSTNLLNC